MDPSYSPLIKYQNTTKLADLGDWISYGATYLFMFKNST
jgi:hypothetical protein